MAKSLDVGKLRDEETLDTLVARDGQTHEEGFNETTSGDNLDDMGFADPTAEGGLADGQKADPQSAPGGMQQFKNSLADGAAGGSPQTKEKDNYDKALEAGIIGAKGLWRVIVDMFKSFGRRTADDIGRLGIMCFYSAAGAAVIGILVSIGAAFAGLPKLGFWGTGGTLFWSFIIPAVFGGVMFGLALEAKSRKPEVLPAEEDLPPDPIAEAYTENIEAAVEDGLSDEQMKELSKAMEVEYTSDEPVSKESEGAQSTAISAQQPDFDALEAHIGEQKRLISRKVLFDTFAPYFALCTPEFRKATALPTDDPAFMSIYGVVTKVVASIKKSDVKNTVVKLREIKDTYFSYILKVEKIVGISGNKGLSDVGLGLESYFRSTIECDDPAEQTNRRLRIKATCVDEGDFYTITITKGASGVITLGDCLKGKRENEFFLKEKNALPLVAGITEDGGVLLEDAQNLDNIMITGKQRSGKSWYVNALLMSLAAFNSPQDVAFIVIDPKQDILFDTFGLLPHVVGVHDQHSILPIMRELIDVEAERRMRTLKDAKCSNIKQYNQLYPDAKMPRIYLFIDEVITVVDSLMSDAESAAEGKKNQADFKSAMKTIMSKLPYVGIGLIFVPHRAVGLVDKTARSLLKLKAAVMADEEEVVETVGKKIDRNLTAPGDIALQLAFMQAPCYVRGPAVATDDGLTVETLERVARGFYKLGVDVPDWSHLTESFNRNEDYVQSRLFGNDTTVHLGV